MLTCVGEDPRVRPSHACLVSSIFSAELENVRLVPDTLRRALHLAVVLVSEAPPWAKALDWNESTPAHLETEAKLLIPETQFAEGLR